MVKHGEVDGGESLSVAMPNFCDLVNWVQRVDELLNDVNKSVGDRVEKQRIRFLLHAPESRPWLRFLEVLERQSVEALGLSEDALLLRSF